MESYGQMIRLTDYAAAQIERLKDDGVQLDPEQILTIAAIGRLVESPTARLSLARGRAVAVGGVELWPLTIAGSDWFSRQVQLASDSGQLFVLAYAMAHGREPLPERDVTKHIKRWAKSLRCTAKELDEACKQVLEQDSQPPTDTAVADSTFGDLSAMLVAVCGGDPAMWEYQVSVRYASEVLSTKLAMMSETDAKKARKLEHEKAMAEYVWSVKNGAAS